MQLIEACFSSFYGNDMQIIYFPREFSTTAHIVHIVRINLQGPFFSAPSARSRLGNAIESGNDRFGQLQNCMRNYNSLDTDLGMFSS